MPNLDGVSACHLVRQFDRTPIIAMTSNIRSDDIQLYFHHGMASCGFSDRVLTLTRNGRCPSETFYPKEST